MKDYTWLDMEKTPWQPKKAILAAFFVAFGIKLFLFDIMIAEGRSMEPAIPEGTVLLINRLAYGFRLPLAKGYILFWALPKKGDIIVFSGPGGHAVVKRCAEIREGTFIALGDNALDSYDSRNYGTVPIEHILGKVVGRQ